MGFLRRFMYGRYGGDQLGRFTIVLYLVLYLLGLALRSGLLRLLSFLVAALTLFRMLSRNIPKRQAENRWYLNKTAPLRSLWRRFHLQRTDKAHKYFKCPHCGQPLRVPRGAGKLRITCRSCGATFEEHS